MFLISRLEIEVAYPAAGDNEFQFVRDLIENNEIPDDVAIQVSCSRSRSCEDSQLHLVDYNSSSPRLDH